MWCVDASPAMIAAARQQGLNAHASSAYDIDYEQDFDAVFSNAALHWMRESDRVISNVFRALKPGGRFVAECGGYGNVNSVRQALIQCLDELGYDGSAADPWYFATAEDYQAKLNAAGFNVIYIELFPRPTPLPGDVLGWLETFADSFTTVLPEEQRADYLKMVRDRIQPHYQGKDGRWVLDYVLLRFKAVKRISTSETCTSG